MIFEKGTYLEEDQLAVINFHLQAGDLSEVTVSDQKRVGVFIRDKDGIHPPQVVIEKTPNELPVDVIVTIR